MIAPCAIRVFVQKNFARISAILLVYANMYPFTITPTDLFFFVYFVFVVVVVVVFCSSLPFRTAVHFVTHF